MRQSNTPRDGIVYIELATRTDRLDTSRGVMDEKELVAVLQERDAAEDWVDRLAAAIAKLTNVDIGEHSSANNPWMNALRAAEEVSR